MLHRSKAMDLTPQGKDRQATETTSLKACKRPFFDPEKTAAVPLCEGMSCMFF